MSEWMDDPNDLEDVLEDDDDSRIAIVGMAGRFPGARNLHEFWHNLRDGVEGVTFFSEEEMLANGVPLKSLRHPNYVRACPVIQNAEYFDAHFFGYSPREAEVLDPQHRLFLEVVWEALEDAGWTARNFEGEVGVFAGSSLSHYLMNNLRDSFTYSERGFESLISNDKDYLASRVAYKLNLGGPGVSVQTACSTSLVAIHLGCQSLTDLETDMVIAGGVTIRLPLTGGYMFQEGGLFSPDGHCRPFDADARGTIFGSGAGAVVLKRLSDALEDGDTIRAVILGSAVNNDGNRKVGYTAPSEHGQVRVLSEALELADAAPETISYIETHGTGTSLGDPIEAAALSKVFGEAPPGETCAIGSVKSNVGHLECAAGIAGLIKTVLAMEHGQIPPTLHFKKLNPHIDFSGGPFYVNAELRDWRPAGGPRRAGVSSFGIGGTNAHIVLEEAPERRKPVRRENRLQILPLSAMAEVSLQETASAYNQLISGVSGEEPPNLYDLCWNMAVHRTHHHHRLAVVAEDHAGLQHALESYRRGEVTEEAVTGQVDPNQKRKVVFVYPGQGSQWEGMVRELLRDEQVFREQMEACDVAVKRHTGWSVLRMLEGLDPARYDQVDVVQPVLFAVSVSLTALWRSWGIVPDAVVGHSQGEIAAAYCAGVLNLDDAARVVCVRSRLVLGLQGKGRMVAVQIPHHEAAEMIAGHEDRVTIAAINGPRGVILSGDPQILAEVVARLEAREVYCGWVNVTYASHSPHVDSVLTELRARLAAVRPQSGDVPLYSTVEAVKTDGAGWGADYWARNLRNTVQFQGALEAARADGHDIFVEISPHPIVTHAIKDCIRNHEAEADRRAAIVLYSLRRELDERRALLENLAGLYAHGADVAWEALFQGPGRRLKLPAYRWHRQRYWVNPSQSEKERGISVKGENFQHPLLAGFVKSSIHDRTYLWQFEVSADTVSYLLDHAVQGQIIVPAAFYIELGMAAVLQACNITHPVLQTVRFKRGLFIPDGGRFLFQVGLQRSSPNVAVFRVSSCPIDGDDWTVHCKGRVALDVDAPETTPTVDVDELKARCGETLSVEGFYVSRREKGFYYGPAFQGLVSLRRGRSEAVGLVKVPDLLVDFADYTTHPAVLDSCFQVLMGAAPDDSDHGLTWLPEGVARFVVHGPMHGELLVHASLQPVREGEPDLRHGEVMVYDEDGVLLLEARDFMFKRVEAEAADRVDELLFRVAWVPVDPAPDSSRVPAQRQSGDWLIFGDKTGLGSALAQSLRSHGGSCVQIQHGEGYRLEDGNGTIDPLNPQHYHDLLAERASWSGVVYLWGLDIELTEDVDGDGLERATQLGCDAPLFLVKALTSGRVSPVPHLTVITSKARPIGHTAAEDTAGLSHVAQSPLNAVCGVIANEYPSLHCRTIDVEPPSDPQAAREEYAHLVYELLGADGEDRIAYRDNRRYGARLVHLDLKEGDPNEPARHAADVPWWRIVIDQPGMLDSLTPRAVEPQEPGPGLVTIEVKVGGLNFHDVLTAMGMHAREAKRDFHLGGECSGVVIAIGEGVEHLHVGDEVAALAHPAHASRVTVPAAFVFPKPEALDFAQAATMLIAPLTATYALMDLARLSAGERVLIHSGAAGTGLAAVKIAKWLGAEVFATAGTEEKRQTLRRLGVSGVYDSRSTRFAQEILRDTNGCGVDVVLNSLTGEGIAAGLDVLAPYGRFIEIGRHDIYQNSGLGMFPFQKNISFHALDASRMMRERPEVVADVVRRVFDLLSEGSIQPLPVTTFPMANAEGAYSLMAKAGHTGKIALVRDETPMKVKTQVVEMSIRAGATYLITGGLSGLGLYLARRIIEDGGAKHMVLLARSAPKAEAAALIEKWRGQDVDVRVMAADVSKYDEMKQVFEDVKAQMPPLRGIVHAAGTLDDANMDDLTPERFRKVMAPKVQGGWNLHLLTKDMRLEWLALFSSVAAVNGTPGQANYAAANGFLDALAAYRRSQRLSALAMNWGGWSEIGLAADSFNQETKRFSITPDEGIRASVRLMRTNIPAQVIVTPTPVPHFLGEQVVSRPFFSLLNQAAASQRCGDPELLEKIKTTPTDERQALLESYLIKQVGAVLRVGASSLRADVPLSQYGLTSLLALELRNRVEGDLGLTIPVLQIFQSQTLDVFAAKILERMALSLVASTPNDSEEDEDEEDWDEVTF